MKAHAVTTIDKATTDRQLVLPTKEAAHQSGEEAATNVSASAQGTADDTNNKVTSNAPSNKPSTAVSTTVNETHDVDARQATTQKPTQSSRHSNYQMLKQHHFHHECLLLMHHKQQHINLYHTNDIHGRLAEEKGRVIGMAKLKTVKNKKSLI